MSRSPLEEEEKPIIDKIWKLDVQCDKISVWFNQFENFSKIDFVRTGIVRNEKKNSQAKGKQNNTVHFCRSRVLAYTLQFKSDWETDVKNIMRLTKVEEFKNMVAAIYLNMFPPQKSHSNIANEMGSSYYSICLFLDRIFHIINGSNPVPLQFISNAIDIANYLCTTYSVSPIVPELLGLVTEIYLMITTCLSSSSLLFQRYNKFGMTAADKILFEVVYLQLFSFPLLSWGELKPEIESLLTDGDLNNKLTCAFSLLYFIYDNTTLNADICQPALCDHTTELTDLTRLSQTVTIASFSTCFQVKSIVVKDIIDRLISKLGDARICRKKGNINFKSLTPFNSSIQYLKLSPKCLLFKDERITELLHRAYKEDFTAKPFLDTDDANNDMLIQKLYIIELHRIPAFQAYIMWLYTILNYLSDRRDSVLTAPPKIALQICGLASPLDDLEDHKGYPMYKQQLPDQYYCYYLNNTLYNHTNENICDCCHCSISHIRKSNNANCFFCRYCCQRFDAGIQSTTNNYYPYAVNAHELAETFEIIPEEEYINVPQEDCLDLYENNDQSDSSDDDEIPILIKLDKSPNDFLPQIAMDKPVESILSSIQSDLGSYNVEFSNFLENQSYKNNDCAYDWLTLKLLNARSILYSLVSSTVIFSDHITHKLEMHCYQLLNPFFHILWLKSCPYLCSIYKDRSGLIQFIFDYMTNMNSNSHQPYLSNESLHCYIPHIIDLCYCILAEYYQDIHKYPSLEATLLNRNETHESYKNKTNEKCDEEIIVRSKQFYVLPPSDIQQLINYCDQGCALTPHFLPMEYQCIINTLGSKYSLNYYTEYYTKYRPSSVVLNEYIDRTNHYPEGNILDHIDRHQVTLHKDIQKYEGNVRKWNTNRYLGEYCFEVMICNELKKYALDNALATYNISKGNQRKDSIHRNSINEEVPSSGHTGNTYTNYSMQSYQHQRVRQDKNYNDDNTYNDETYGVDEVYSDNHDYSNESNDYMHEHNYICPITSPHMPIQNICYAIPSTTMISNSNLTTSPMMSSLQISPTIYSNNVIPVIYPYAFVQPQQYSQSTIFQQSQQSQSLQQLQQSQQLSVTLPPGFEHIIEPKTNRRVYELYAQLEPEGQDSSVDRTKLNYFFGYSVFWLLSSLPVRNTIVKGVMKLNKKHENHLTVTTSRSTQPTSAETISLSPTIQPACVALNVAPQTGYTKNEMEILYDFVNDVNSVVESSQNCTASNFCVKIFDVFVSNNLLGKYQQFGDSTEDAIDFLLVNLHHIMNSVCVPPTSIVNYMQCTCDIHQSLTLHYSFTLACGCPSETTVHHKSTMWIHLQGTLYHNFITDKLRQRSNQPSEDAAKKVQLDCCRHSLAQFIKNSLLPFTTECPTCHQSRSPVISIDAPYPKVLLIRFTWSTTFPSKEKNLTFCGIPEKLDLSDICPKASGIYTIKSVLVRSKEKGEAVISWNNTMKRFVLYTIYWSASMQTFSHINSYCSQLQFQPLLLLYELEPTK